MASLKTQFKKVRRLNTMEKVTAPYLHMCMTVSLLTLSCRVLLICQSNLILNSQLTA